MKKREPYFAFAFVIALFGLTLGFYAWNEFSSPLFLSPPNSAGSCVDYDQGFYPSVASKIDTSNYNFGENLTFSDYCSSANTVVEYSCDSAYTYSAKSYSCLNGCSNGACVYSRYSYMLNASVKTTTANLTDIRKFSNGAWSNVCTNKGNGASCDLGTFALKIVSVNNDSTSKWTDFNFGSSGRAFRPVNDINKNYIYLPLQSELPRAIYNLYVYDVDTTVPLQNFTLTWNAGKIAVSSTKLLKNHTFSFVVSPNGDSVELRTKLVDGDVTIPLLYGNGTKFIGVGRNSGERVATSDNNDVRYNITNGDVLFVASTGSASLNQTICGAAYIANLTSCLPDETIVKYFYGDANCNIPLPQNSTYSICDYNNNHIIGDEEDVDSNFEVTLYSDGNPINLSQNFTGVKEMGIYDDEDLKVEFDYDFTNKVLNLNDIYVRKQSGSGDFGYIIVNGLENISKTVNVDKLNDGDSVCIKDEKISGIGSISSDCDEDDETLLICDGDEEDGFSCTDEGDYFVVSGLTHSAVKEFEEGDGNSGCSPLWSCSSWSTCDNGLQTRLCTDTHYCGESSGKPAESQSCGSSYSESSSTSCFDQGGEVCTVSESCSGSISSSSQGSCCIGECQLSSSETKSAQSQGGLFFWIIIGILIISIVVVIVLIVLGIKQSRSVQTTS